MSRYIVIVNLISQLSANLIRIILILINRSDSKNQVGISI